MLAQRADIVLRERLALIDIAADLADKAGLLLGGRLGLRLDVLKIVAYVADGTSDSTRASVTSARNRVCVPQSSVWMTLPERTAFVPAGS